MIAPFPGGLLRVGAEGTSPVESSGQEAVPSAADRSEVTDADILLGLVGRPLPWWRLIGW